MEALSDRWIAKLKDHPVLAPLIVVGIVAIAFVSFGGSIKTIWSWFVPDSTKLVAYGEGVIDFPFSDGSISLNGYSFQIRNVSQGGVEATLARLTVTVQGVPVLSRRDKKIGYIDPQNTVTISEIRSAAEGPVPIPRGTPSVSVEYEVNYDSVPKSGRRTSIRKEEHRFDWTTGPRSAPHVAVQSLERSEQ